METRGHADQGGRHPTSYPRSILLAVMFFWGLSPAGIAHAATQYVGPAATGSGSGADRNNLKSLAAAMTSAKPGDLFLLQPGSYGNVVLPNTGYGSAAGGYVTYRADPATCAPRGADWFNGVLPRATPATSPVLTGLSFSDDYFASGKARPKYVEIDGLCLVNGQIVLRNHAAHVRILNCNLWGYVPADPVYHYADARTNDGIIWAPYYNNTGSDFNNITVDRCYFDFMQEGIDYQGNTSGNILISNCHVRDTAGSPLSARPAAITGTVKVIGNHLEHEVMLPWASDGQSGYTVAAPSPTAPSQSFTYQGATPPSGTFRFWVRVDATSRGLSALRPIASMTDTSVTLAAPLPFNVQAGDQILFHGVMHGSGVAIWGSNVTVQGNYVHDCGTTSGIFLYQKAMRNIIIENNLVYDVINPYAVMLGEPGNNYSYGNNLRIVNNTFIGRRAQEYQALPERTYGFALFLQADPTTDLSTVTICNNLLVGATWTAPAGATVQGNILYSGSGYSEGAVGTNRGNRIYYHGQAYPNQPYPFEGSGKYFAGGPDFDAYAFGMARHGRNFNDGDLMPVTGSDPIDSAVAAQATTTDITGQTRGTSPDTGCYQTGTSPALVLTPVGNKQVTAGQALTFTVSASGGSGSLVYSASGLPTGASFSGQTFTWTPGTAQVGSYQVTFTVSDGKTQDAKTVTITVAGQPNSAPVLAPIGDKTIQENQLLTFGIGATDTDSDPITYSATGLPSGASLTSRTFAWTPTYTQAGSYNVTFTASDGQAQDSQTITITVANVDRPPVLADIGSQSVTAASALSFTLSAADPDGDSLSYSAGTLPAGATLTGSSFGWTPTVSQVGSYQITFTASDGTLSSSKTAGITVMAPANSAPVLAPIGNKSVNENQLLTFGISATDAGNSPITYSATGLPSGAGLNGQTFNWTPTYSQAGSYSVTFTASDGQAQDSETITITVANINRPPVLAAIGSKSVNENQLLTFAISATDPDGNPIIYSVTGLPSGAGFSGQTFNWTPGYSQAGNYSVTFTTSDGQAQDSETITVTVANIDRPPVLASIGSKSVNVGTTLSFALSATDPDGDNLSYSAGTLPSGATLTGQSFAWTPAGSQTGSYSMTFTVSDGTLTDAETVAITVVNPTNDRTAPVVAQCSPAPDAIQVPLNNVVTLHVTDPNSGVDANTMTIRVNGSIVYQGNVSTYAGASGQCSRSGTKNDYQFLYQPKTAFDFDQVVAVRVDAADLAGNIMGEYSYSFTTEMRAFGRNLPVSTLGSSADSQAVTACDPAGNLWVTWADGPVGSRDIYVAQRTLGAKSFSKPLRLTTDSRDQCCPALCIDDSSVAYVAWQDNRSGNWDIYLSLCRPGASFSSAVKVTTSTHNETNPSLAVDHQSPGGVYVAWQDDRNGNGDIYVAGSANGFASSTLWQVTSHAANQTEPVVAVDAANSVYVFWTDLRNGVADLYGASSVGAWTNVPVVTGPGAQMHPAVAAGADGTLHLVWADNRSGDNDIYYAALAGLPTSPVAGVDLVDDTTGAEQTAPVVACGANQKVFACWIDARHASATDQDTDLYVVEVRSGTAGTNVFVGDDGTNANQGEPSLGVDHYGQPYVVWTDWRRQATEIYYAGTTQVSPTTLDSRRVAASAGAALGTDPAALSTAQDVSLVIPPGACQTDVQITISSLINPQVAEEVLLGGYEFSPSGITFAQPVTVTIAYATSGNGSRALPYWYDSVTGALSQQGITQVQNLYISAQLSALQFRTTHFTPFYVVVADSTGTSGGGGGGGCALAPGQTGSPAELVVPYAAVALIVLILRRRDRRNRMRLEGRSR